MSWRADRLAARTMRIWLLVIDSGVEDVSKTLVDEAQERGLELGEEVRGEMVRRCVEDDSETRVEIKRGRDDCEPVLSMLLDANC